MSPTASIPAEDEPYTGPETGEVLTPADLAELERLALEYSAGAITQALPVAEYSGPVTGQMTVLPITKEGRPLEQLREGRHGGRHGGRRRAHGPAVAPGRGRRGRRRCGTS